MIQRRTSVKDPSESNAAHQQPLAEIDVSKDEKKGPAMKTRSHEAEQEVDTGKALQYELQKKDEEIWKLNKRIEDLEKASGHFIQHCSQENKTPPPGYICYRCRIPGHFIHHCPTIGDLKFDNNKMSRSLAPVVTASPVDGILDSLVPTAPVSAVDDLPAELHCRLCKKVMRDAVLTSKCCFDSFCDRCIRDYIITESKCICGVKTLADDLIPNHTLRSTISNMLGTQANSGGSGTIRHRSSSGSNPDPKIQSHTASAASAREVKQSTDHQLPAASAPDEALQVSVYSAVAKERTSENAQTHEASSSEIYEKDLKDTKASEENYARNAAILAKELKQEKLSHAETLKKLHATEQKLQNELKRKDNEIIQKLNKSEVLEQDELATTVVPYRKNDDQKQATVCASDSAKSQDLRDKVKEIQRYIDGLESSRVELIRKSEEAKDLLKKCSASDIPELFKGSDLQMNCKDDLKHAKSDSLIELNLALKITKCHDIFICPLEVGSEQLIDLIAAEGCMIARVCNIPGEQIYADLPEDGPVRHQKYIPPHRRVSNSPEPPMSKMNMFGKFLIGGITECLFRLHRLGLCLNGNFSLKSFYHTTSKKIKLGADVKSNACHRTIHGMNLDYYTIHDIIINILAICRHGTPFDLKLLLDLLCSQDPSEKQIIIRYNASLMDEIQKRNHFIIMYSRFKQIAQEDGSTERVKKVLKFIKPDPGWETRLYDNKFTAMVSARHAADSNRIPNEKMDLLDIWRHSFTHLHEKSTALNDEDQVDIMDSVSRGVINQLQEGMHSIQELELPHLMHTMKK